MAIGLTIGGEVTPDPLPTPPANIVETPTGVAVDPSKPAEEPKPEVKKPTYEELEKSYNELRTKMSKEGAPKPEEKPAGEQKPEEKPAAAKPLSTAEAQKAVTDAGLDMAKLEQEYAANGGKLSEESLKALEAKGLSRETVQTYIAGQEAVANQVRGEFTKIAGGEDGLKAMLAWANTNLTEAEAKVYNDAIDSGNVGLAKMLFEGIASRYTAANGKEPQLVTGGTVPGATGEQPFESWAQVTEAMSDPRYKEDSAYRAKVAKRLAVSTKI